MAGRQDYLERLNPLRCGAGDLPLQAMLVVKLLVIFAVLTKIPGGSHTVAPFIPWLESIPYPDTIRLVLKLGIAVACLGLFCNFFGRKACFYIGSASLLIILWSRLNFSNNQLYLTLLFLFLGLHVKGETFWSIRITTGLLYLGAGLNKLLTPDWQTGRFIEYWYTVAAPMQWFDGVASLVGTSNLSLALGWSVIAIELILAFLFLTKIKLRWALVLGLSFHLGMLFATGGLLSHRFMYLMASAYLLFIAWPNAQLCEVKVGRVFFRLKYLDFDKQFRWSKVEGLRLLTISNPGGKIEKGFLALISVLIRLPAIWIPCAGIYGLIIFGWP